MHSYVSAATAAAQKPHGRSTLSTRTSGGQPGDARGSAVHSGFGYMHMTGSRAVTLRRVSGRMPRPAVAMPRVPCGAADRGPAPRRSSVLSGRRPVDNTPPPRARPLAGAGRARPTRALRARRAWGGAYMHVYARIYLSMYLSIYLSINIYSQVDKDIGLDAVGRRFDSPPPAA